MMAISYGIVFRLFRSRQASLESAKSKVEQVCVCLYAHACMCACNFKHVFAHMFFCQMTAREARMRKSLSHMESRVLALTGRAPNPSDVKTAVQKALGIWYVPLQLTRAVFDVILCSVLTECVQFVPHPRVRLGLDCTSC